MDNFTCSTNSVKKTLESQLIFSSRSKHNVLKCIFIIYALERLYVHGPVHIWEKEVCLIVLNVHLYCTLNPKSIVDNIILMK